jgi:hypothetical protein
MNRYFWLLIRFVNDEHDAGERRAIYDRARDAFYLQLYNADPPLSEDSVSYERFAFEEAVRTVESSITRWGRAPNPAEPSV